jgi:HK97 family phage major capsid protein
MSRPTQEFLTRLERRRDGIVATAENFCLEIRSQGREAFTIGEAERLRHMTADIDSLNESIHEYRDKLRRAEIPEHLKNLGGGREHRRGGEMRPDSAGMLAPLAFPESELRRLHTAAQRGEPCRISAERRFSSADSLLPPELYPFPIAWQHEWRVLDRLPGYATDLPSIEFIRHVSTTGSAGSVAEGALKPEITLVADKLVAPVVKLAGHLALSREIIDDWDSFHQYATAELYKQVVDVENGELLAGDGTGTDMTGFYATSGILTHDCAADTGTGETVWDSLEKSIAELRSGSALAEPDLAIFHPDDWSTIRRVKDAYSRYLVSPDPSTDQVNEAWGVPVLVTTQNPRGQGLLIDTRKFGQVAVRSPLGMILGYANDDLTRNLLRFVAEERLVLTVTRPAAVLKIFHLPAPTTSAAETKTPAKK